MGFLLLLLCYLLATSMGLLLIKLGGAGTSFSIASQSISMQMDFKLIIGLMCYAASFVLFSVILQKQNLSIIYPLCAGVVNIVSVVLGVVVLRETISNTGIIGIALIIVGIVLMNLGR